MRRIHVVENRQNPATLTLGELLEDEDNFVQAEGGRGEVGREDDDENPRVLDRLAEGLGDLGAFVDLTVVHEGAESVVEEALVEEAGEAEAGIPAPETQEHVVSEGFWLNPASKALHYMIIVFGGGRKSGWIYLDTVILV